MGDGLQEKRPNSDGGEAKKPDMVSDRIKEGFLDENERISFWKLFKSSWVSVLTDCLVFGSFGMGVAFLGPTLFDLGCQTNSPLQEMNWVFFVQLFLTLIGSISAGCLADRVVPIHVLMVVGVVGMPITMFLIPACTVLAGLLINLMLMGWCMGCIDCMANLRLIQRFGTNVSPFMQAMHFCYGLGAFISPMIAAPFLLNIDCSQYIDGTTMTAHNHTVNVSPRPQVVSQAHHLSHSEVAFFILGSIQLGIALIVVVTIIAERRSGASLSFSSSSSILKHLPQEGTDSPVTDVDDGCGGSLLSLCFTCGTKQAVVITILASLSMFIYDGLQSSYGDYIYSYAEISVKGLQKQEGAILNSCFWGTFALGRLISIAVATQCTPSFMLITNMIGCALALIMTLIWRTSHVMIYIGTCLIGLFLSSMSPSAMSMTEQFVSINPSMTACLVVLAALGETLCPVIVGNLFISRLGHVSFLGFCAVILVLALILYMALLAVGRRTDRYRETPRTSFFLLAGLDRKRAGESSLIKPTTVKYYSRMEEESENSMEMAGIKSIDDDDKDGTDDRHAVNQHS